MVLKKFHNYPNRETNTSALQKITTHKIHKITTREQESNVKPS